MQIRKSMTAIGAALMMVGVSAYAGPPAVYCGADSMNPDSGMIESSLTNLSDYLRSTERADATVGPWPYDAIWQKRGTGSFEVQDSLAKKLYEERNFDVENPKPPKNKNNDAAGAAWDVRNGKYQSAVDKLDAFVADAYKSRLDVWADGNEDFENALDAKTFFVNEVIKARGCICKLTECE
jgi:hypothetical protein